jgi:hypothetical protein
MRNYEQGKDRRSSNEGRLNKVSGALLVRRFSVREPEMYRVVEEVLAKRLNSMDKEALCELAQTAMDLELDRVEGDFILAGEDAGIAAVLEKAKRRSRELIICRPEDGPGEGECALAYLNIGDQEPMRTLLQDLVPRLVPGGTLIVDRYKSPECRKAVDEYFQGRKGFHLIRKSRLHIIRNS